MVTEPGGVPGDERVDAVQTLYRLCVAGACLLVAVLDCGEFGRQGAAQHDDLAKIVAARLVRVRAVPGIVLRGSHASCNSSSTWSSGLGWA